MALNPNSLAPVLRRSIDCIESFMDDLHRDSDGYGQCEDLIADLRWQLAEAEEEQLEKAA